MQDPDPQRRRLAIEGLGRISDASLLPALKKDFQREGDGELRLAYSFVLSDDEKVIACLLAAGCGIDFVKTSTGFAGGGATPADVALMRRTVGYRLGVKAAGGVRTLADARAMVEAGASRLGASAGVNIARQAVDEAAAPEAAPTGY